MNTDETANCNGLCHNRSLPQNNDLYLWYVNVIDSIQFSSVINLYSAVVGERIKGTLWR